MKLSKVEFVLDFNGRIKFKCNVRFALKLKVDISFWFLVFLQLQHEFSTLRFLVQPSKCVAWFHKGWTTLYHFLLVFLFSIWVFIFWAHWWDPNHSLSYLWLKFFMRILGWYLISLCLQILKRLLRSSRCVMLNALVIYFVQYFHLQIFCKLCRVWYLNHGYIREVIWCKIFWWFYRSPRSSSNHSSYFFGWVWPPFYGSNCYSRILGMLGSNCSYICHLFPTWWSPLLF